MFFAGFNALLDAAIVGLAFLEKEKIADIVAAELLRLLAYVRDNDARTGKTGRWLDWPYCYTAAGV